MCCANSRHCVLNFGVWRLEGVGDDFVKDISLTRVNKDTIQVRDRIQMECQDPLRQATVTSDRAGLGRLWIGLGFRFPQSTHLLFSPTFHAVHTPCVLSRKTSFHCVHTFGHNLTFCMIIPSDPTFYFRTSLLFYSDAQPYFIVPEVHLFVYLLSCSVLSFYSF